MKPITCSDVEPTLIEYFSSADDVGLEESNQYVPQLILAHLDDCSDCAEQFQGFRQTLQSPVTAALPDGDIQPVHELVQFIDSQVQSFNMLINCASEAREEPVIKGVDQADKRATLSQPAWLSRFKSMLAPLQNIASSPQLGFAAASIVVALLVLVLWQPTPQFNQSIVGYQAKLDITPQSVEYVYSMKKAAAPKPWMAFSSSQNKFNPFLIGNFYSESIALFLQQDIQASNEHLSNFADYLKNYPQLKNSYEYVVKLQQMLQQELSLKATDQSSAQNEQQAISDKKRVLSLFAAFPRIYKNEVAQMSPQQAFMFDFGSWVINLNLAALSHYPGLANEKSNLIYFNESVKSVGLPSGVTKSLDQIGELLNSRSLSEQEYQQIFLQGMNLKNQLG